jgi:hypothetical protein
MVRAGFSTCGAVVVAVIGMCCFYPAQKSRDAAKLAQQQLLKHVRGAWRTERRASPSAFCVTCRPL